jgi:hypothetical protein
MEHTSKIDVVWFKSDLVSTENAKKIEFDWEHLILSLDCDWDFHGPLLILVFWRDLLILSNEVFLTSLQNASIWSEFCPYLE